MSASSSASTPASPRPRLVDAAFWCLVAGAVLVIVGGLMATALTPTFDAARAAISDSVTDDQVRSYLTMYRVSGLGSVVAAAALAYLAGRARRGDARFRLATLGLAFALVLVVLLLAFGIGVVQPLTLIALLPVLVGAALLSMPAARVWYEREGS